MWDDVDQRWVVPALAAAGAPVPAPAPASPAPASLLDPFSPTPPPATAATPVGDGGGGGGGGDGCVGIRLDTPLDETGKAPEVVAAMRERRQSLVDSQAKAKAEVKEREAKRAAEEDEFAQLRLALGPQLKTWSEQYGKKKDIRALLAGVHDVIWEGSGWKPLGIGDLLDAKKVRLGYQKAALRVHPDRLTKKPIEQQFVGRYIFDALSQAFSEWEANGSK